MREQHRTTGAGKERIATKGHFKVAWWHVDTGQVGCQTIALPLKKAVATAHEWASGACGDIEVTVTNAIGERLDWRSLWDQWYPVAAAPAKPQVPPKPIKFPTAPTKPAPRPATKAPMRNRRIAKDTVALRRKAPGVVQINGRAYQMDRTDLGVAQTRFIETVLRLLKEEGEDVSMVDHIRFVESYGLEAVGVRHG